MENGSATYRGAEDNTPPGTPLHHIKKTHDATPQIPERHTNMPILQKQAQKYARTEHPSTTNNAS